MQTAWDIVSDLLEYYYLQGHRWSDPSKKAFSVTGIGLIVGLITAGIKIHNNWDRIMDIADILKGMVEDMLETAYKKALAYLEKLKTFCQKMYHGAKSAVTAGFSSCATWIMDVFDSRIRDYSTGRLQSLLDIIQAFESIPFFDVNIWGYKYAGEPWFARLSLDGVQSIIKTQYAMVTQENENNRDRLLAVFDEIENIDIQYAGKIKTATGELRQMKAQLKLI